MKKYGLIGFPLSHSFSQNYFTQKFKDQKISASYLNLEINSLNQLRRSISELDWSGFNVTIPHKLDIIPLLDQLDESAQAVGAVNCVLIRENLWIGYNTDSLGFLQSISPILKPEDTNALILGTGGASKAVAHALQQLTISFDFASRNENKGIKYENLSLADYQIIINTTPLGTYPNTQYAPDIPYHELNSSHICYDLVYNPAKSLFLEKSEQRGAQIKNGLEMLELQAEAAWEIWQD